MKTTLDKVVTYFLLICGVYVIALLVQQTYFPRKASLSYRQVSPSIDLDSIVKDRKEAEKNEFGPGEVIDGFGRTRDPLALGVR